MAKCGAEQIWHQFLKYHCKMWYKIPRLWHKGNVGFWMVAVISWRLQAGTACMTCGAQAGTACMTVFVEFWAILGHHLPPAQHTCAMPPPCCTAHGPHSLHYNGLAVLTISVNDLGNQGLVQNPLSDTVSVVFNISGTLPSLRGCLFLSTYRGGGVGGGIAEPLQPPS